MNDACPGPASLLDGLAALFDAHPRIRDLTLGYSGGMDSHALLHLLASHRHCWPRRALAAVYVDHGLQAASAAWGEHCAAICRELSVPFQVLRVDARPAPGESPEAAARRARYAALAAELDPATALLTAHHRDDQAETLLLQLLRGAGPHGLAAMPAASRLGPGWLLRPLLNVDRADLRTHALEHGLRWIEDGGNQDSRFDRNYLRQRILPLLRERWPAVGRNLARSAQWCAETADWLDADADADLARAATSRPNALHIPALRELGEPRQRNVLRRWLRRLGLPVPDARQLRHVLHDALSAARDRQPCIHWPGGEVRRDRDTLYALPPLVAHDARQIFIWRHEIGGYPPLELPGLGTLRLRETFGEGLRSETLAGAVLAIRFRQGGERFRPVGRHHSQELKKLLQEAGIPPWQRDRLPLLYLPPPPRFPLEGGGSQGLLAVVGLGIAAEAAAGPGEPGLLPVLQSPSATGFGIL